VLIVLGVPQTLAGPATVTTLEGLRKSLLVDQLPLLKSSSNRTVAAFFANSAHPFENPNGGTNLIEILAMLCIPAALIYTYGLFANNSKLGYFLDGVCHLCSSGWGAVGEYQGNPLVNSILGSEQPNLEAKKSDLAGHSVLGSRYHRNHVWSCQRMHDSLMPTGGFSTLFNLFFADYLGWPRNWNGLLIYLLNSDGVPDWSDGGTNPEFWVAN